ncbi:MAG: type II secretion system F family protein [Gammaproteobacteria bacterium]|nr:type II secretion system F family protein [Gammaproteobacteria bacterium]
MAIDIGNQSAASASPKVLTGLTKGLNKRHRVGSKDRKFFTERLTLLLQTGVNLHAALQSLKKQTDNPAMVAVVDALIRHISEGKSFSYALAEYPEMFSRTYINLVAASENGGFMPQVLEELLEMEEKRERLRSTLFSALSYPAFLVVFSVAVVIFVLMVVFPKFAVMFESIRDQLPGTTLTLMWMSESLKAYWLPLMASSVLFMFGLKRWMMSHSGRYRVDQLKLAIPVLKDVFVQLYLVQSMRVMSLSLKNGVGIVDTLVACKEVVGNSVYQRFLADLETNVQEGSGLSVGFSHTRFIPPIVQQMIATGEETANLPKVMARIADFYEHELSKKLTALSKIAEPLMLLVMGVVVGVIVSSLILPIFKLSKAVY